LYRGGGDLVLAVWKMCIKSEFNGQLNTFQFRGAVEHKKSQHSSQEAQSTRLQLEGVVWCHGFMVRQGRKKKKNGRRRDNVGVACGGYWAKNEFFPERADANLASGGQAPEGPECVFALDCHLRSLIGGGPAGRTGGRALEVLQPNVRHLILQERKRGAHQG